MKLVVLSQRVDVIPERGERRDALDQRLVAFILAAGGLAVAVPNTLVGAGQLETWLDRLQPDAVVLSGGNDIGAAPERDATETALLTYAAAHRLPLLGICRGMQMLGHVAGVALQAVDGHVAVRHILLGVPPRAVNSYHAFSLAQCPDEYEILARSGDGEIEAIKHRQLPWVGWMWHPERESEWAQCDLDDFMELIG